MNFSKYKISEKYQSTFAQSVILRGLSKFSYFHQNVSWNFLSFFCSLQRNMIVNLYSLFLWEMEQWANYERMICKQVETIQTHSTMKIEIMATKLNSKPFHVTFQNTNIWLHMHVACTISYYLNIISEKPYTDFNGHFTLLHILHSHTSCTR